MAIKPVSFDETDLLQLLHPVPIDTQARRKRRQFLAGLITLLILWEVAFVSSNFPAYWHRLQPLKQVAPLETIQATPEATTTTEVTPLRTKYSPTLVSEKIALTAPIVFSVPELDVLDRLLDGVVGLAGTALPNEVGNTVLLGHSSNLAWRAGDYKTIFSLLDRLDAGDKITIFYQYDSYEYEVTEKKVIRPTDLSVLEKTPTPTLTLITCYPIGTANSRLVIRARLVSGLVDGEQSSSPLANYLPKAR